jgi:hypothetical protein
VELKSYVLGAPNALGIGAASFASGASKDIAESPTALPERPKKKNSEIPFQNSRVLSSKALVQEP